MARNKKEDRAKTKAKRDKKIAIGGGVVLLILLGVQGPKTLKMLSSKPKPPVVSATPTTPSTASGSPTSVAAPDLAGGALATAASSGSTQLVSSVQPVVDQGQLSEFSRFASKDPFAVQVTHEGGSAASQTSTTDAPASTTPTAPTTPSAAAPTSAVISVNGELGAVSVGADFPTAGAVFSRFGAIFHLVGLTQTSAKISVVGGSYADGAGTVTLRVGKAVTLQNTADGTRYTLILEPQGTQVPAAGAAPTFSTPSSTTPVTTTPTTTTPAP